MFPSSYTWDAVMANVTDLLSESLVATGVLLSIAIPWVIKLVRTAKRATSAR